MVNRNRFFLFSAFFITLGIATWSSPSLSYDEFSHEWITRNSLDYLRTNPHAYTETDLWMEKVGAARGFGEDTLVRAVVDTDYRSDMWLDAIFHKPFTGGEMSGKVTNFTSLFHFINVSTPGVFWAHDGFAYRHSTKQGNDAYLGYFSVSIKGQDSVSLGGRAPAGEGLHGAALGVYNLGFQGTTHDWSELFDGGSGAAAVFPPSTVPAQAAYNVMLATERALNNKVESWKTALPLVTGLLSTTDLVRNYWRGEIAGLPLGWDLLGMSMHLTQDATVPQHTEGTSDNCHPEYENMVDQATCGTTGALDRSAYYDGTYKGYKEGCGQLYDANLVTKILAEFPYIGAESTFSVKQRMESVALMTARWKWKTRHNLRYAKLPNGSTHKAKDCITIFTYQDVMEQTKFQYNLAIAQTVALFEHAAHEYETTHAPVSRIPTPESLMRFLIPTL